MLLRWLQQQELIDEHMVWWVMNIVLERGLLRLESSMYILGFFGINNGMEFMLSILRTFEKVFIDFIFASIHTSFVLLQL